jgi:hypothetical protein
MNASAFLSVVCLFAAAPADGATPPADHRRIVMVLPFDGTDSKLTERFADSFRLKLAREVRRLGDKTNFEVLSATEVAEAWGEGAAPRLDTPPQDIGKWLHQVAAHVAIWGSVVRDGDDLVTKVRTMDVTDDPGRLWFDETWRGTGERAHVAVLNQAVERITGQAVRKPREAGDVPEPRELGPMISRNPGFEEGSGDQPTGWDRIDGLTTYWVDDPTGAGRGKIIKMDTRMLQSQADEWWPRWRAGAPASQAPKPIMAKPPGYDAVGGLHGAHYYSEYLEVKPGMRYRVLADMSGQGGGFFFPKVFVKGYATVPATVREKQPDRREIWRMYLACRNSSGGWMHYSETFTIPAAGVKMSDKTSLQVQWIRIIPYGYWPPGVCLWDNVKVVEEPE